MPAPTPPKPQLSDAEARNHTMGYSRFLKKRWKQSDLKIISTKRVAANVIHVAVWDPGIVVGGDVRIPLTVKKEKDRKIKLYDPFLMEWWPRH